MIKPDEFERNSDKKKKHVRFAENLAPHADKIPAHSYSEEASKYPRFTCNTPSDYC